MKKKIYTVGIGILLFTLSGCGSAGEIQQTLQQTTETNITTNEALPPIPEVPSE